MLHCNADNVVNLRSVDPRFQVGCGVFVSNYGLGKVSELVDAASIKVEVCIFDAESRPYSEVVTVAANEVQALSF